MVGKGRELHDARLRTRPSGFEGESKGTGGYGDLKERVGEDE